MRITSNMLIANSIWNISNNMERLDKAQERMATQSKIQLPSDDPQVATQAIKYRNYVANVEQYQKNVDDATSWMQVTDGALDDLGSIIRRLKELTVQASNTATQSATDQQAIKAEVTQLKGNVIQLMNSSYAGRYVFGGYNTDQEPFKVTPESINGTTVDKVMFKDKYLDLGGPVPATITDADYQSFCETQANAGQIYQSAGSQSIKYNIGFSNDIAVNVEGQDVIGQGNGNNLFDTLDKLLLGLDGSTSYKTATITGTPPAVTATVDTTNFALTDILADLDNDLNRVLNIRADLGARMNYVNLTADRLSNDDITYTKLKSTNENVDVAQASIDVSTSQAVYDASLTVGAKAMTKSLVDYLR